MSARRSVRHEVIGRLSVGALLAIYFGLLCGCNLIAGLGDFEPPTGASGSTGDSMSSSGGDGGAAQTSGSGMTSSSKGASVSAGSGGGGPNCASHLLVNEVFIQTGDFVELFNPTSATIPLDGMTLHALTGSGNLGLKWTANAGAKIGPHGFYLLTADPGGDDMLTSGIASIDPTVVILYDSASAPIDSVCVCSGTSLCEFAEGADEYCMGRALSAPSFHLATDLASAQRTSCVDTDLDSNDFTTACPTPGGKNLTAGACQ